MAANSHPTSRKDSDDRPQEHPRHNWRPELAAGLSRRLRMAMAALGLRQKKLIGELRYTQPAVSRLVRGASYSIPLDIAVALCQWADGAGISVRWLMTGEGEMLKKEPTEQ